MTTLAELITIGNEILYGQTLDTNSHWISGELDAIGIKVIRKTTIPDLEEHILKTFGEAEGRADIVLITGGPGSTNDDLTKLCLAKYLGVKLDLNKEALEEITERHARADPELNEPNKRQALQPVISKKITNDLGTAPGIWLEKNDTIFISMPGVPFEMKGMMEDTVLPELQKRYVKEKIYHGMPKTVGIPGSKLAEKLVSWEQAQSHIRLASLPSLAQVELRLTGVGDDLKLKTEVNEQSEAYFKMVGKYVCENEEISLEKRIGQLMQERNKTLAIAESCTGGYLSHLITSVPGSSAYFNGSFVPYSNELKEKALHVRKQTLIDHGAVSKEVVKELAENVRNAFNSSIGLSISGTAGPGGGTDEKPVGTVWIGYSDDRKTEAKKFIFTKNRMLNIQLAANVALNMIRLNLVEMSK